MCITLGGSAFYKIGLGRADKGSMECEAGEIRPTDQGRYEHRWDESQESPNREYAQYGAGPKVGGGDLAREETVPYEEVGHDPVDDAGRESRRKAPLTNSPEEVQRDAVQSNPNGSVVQGTLYVRRPGRMPRGRGR